MNRVIHDPRRAPFPTAIATDGRLLPRIFVNLHAQGTVISLGTSSGVVHREPRDEVPRMARERPGFYNQSLEPVFYWLPRAMNFTKTVRPGWGKASTSSVSAIGSE